MAVKTRVRFPFKGAGGRREAALGGDAHGAGDRGPEGQADLSRGPGEGAGGLQGLSASVGASAERTRR